MTEYEQKMLDLAQYHANQEKQKQMIAGVIVLPVFIVLLILVIAIFSI